MKKLFIYSDSQNPFWIESFQFETLITCEAYTTFYIKENVVGQIPNTMAFKIKEL